jgi:hypothetical protein
LDVPRMMMAPLPRKRAINFKKKNPTKSGIQVRSHLRKSRKAATSTKFKLNIDQEEVPNNDPKLEESLRLVSKMQFDDLMRFRQKVFYNNNH